MTGAELSTVVTIVAIVAVAISFSTWSKAFWGSKKDK